MSGIELIIGYFLINLFKSGNESVLDSIIRPVTQSVNALIPTKKADLATYLRLARYEPGNYEAFRDIAKMNGYNEQESLKIYQGFREKLPFDLYVWAARRNIINPLEYEKAMAAIGHEYTDLKIAKEFLVSYPDIRDLITFAVRECNDPEAIELGGLDAFFPTQLLADGEKLGYKPTDLHNYWKSHWNIPGINNCFEMFQRGVMSESELDKTLRYNDYAPGYIEKLKKIAYVPIGRVDIRRLYRFGVIKEDDLQNRFEQIGYSPKDSKSMSEFTVKYEDEDESGISKATVLGAYKKGVITKEIVEEKLKIINYTENTIAFLIEIADYEIETNVIIAQINLLKTKVKKGIYTANQAIVEMQNIDIAPFLKDQISYEMRKIEIETYKVVGIGVLFRWLKKGVISGSEFKTLGVRYGYEIDVLNLYLDELNIDTDRI